MKAEQFKATIFEKITPLIAGNVVIIELEGAQINSVSKMYEVLKSPLKFPMEYEDNLDGLFDLLIDLAWLKERPVHIIIRDFDFFLDAETQEKKIQALLTLTDAGQSWVDMKESQAYFNISIQQTVNLQDLLEMCEVGYIIG